MPVVLLVGLVAWVGIRGLIAKAELEQAEAEISQLRESAAELDFASVDELFVTIAGRTATARALTSDPVWRMFEVLPGIGPNFVAVHKIAAVTDDVVDAASPAAQFAGGLDASALAPVDGALPLDLVTEAVPIVEELAQDLPALRDRAAAIDTTDSLREIGAARDRVVALLDEVGEPLSTASTLLPRVPSLLGSDGVRTYVVMFQNNAEARSLGGTALSFAVITIDKGKIAFGETVPAGNGNFPVFDVSPVPVPDGFDAIFPGAFGQFVANATLRPSFPSAAEIVAQNWLEIRGFRPDGVISIDAVALSYVLRATGPIPLASGDTLTADNVVDLLLNEILMRYNSGDLSVDNALQDAVYADAVGRTFTALAGGAFDTPTLLAALAEGFGERRVAYWDGDLETQAVVAHAGLANDLPSSTEDVDAVGIFINDNVGSKLSYYLTASVDAASAVCSEGRSVHRISVHLENGIPAGTETALSPLVLGEYKREGLEPGVQRMMLLVYAPPGSVILGANINGTAAIVDPLHDTDRPVARLIGLIPPGASATLTVDLLMGQPGERSLDLTVTPLTRPTPTAQYGLDCASVVLPG